MNGGLALVVLGLLKTFLLGAVVVIAVIVLVASPAIAAAFADDASTGLGRGIGLTFGSLPNLVESIRKGIELCR